MLFLLVLDGVCEGVADCFGALHRRVGMDHQAV
jgi:hypothetical protein